MVGNRPCLHRKGKCIGRMSGSENLRCNTIFLRSIILNFKILISFALRISLPSDVCDSSIRSQKPHSARHKKCGKEGYFSSGPGHAMLSGIPGL